MKKLVLLAVVILGFAATSFAQLSAKASAFAMIELPTVAAPTMVWVDDLSFGSINVAGIATGATGTVTMAAVASPTPQYSGNITAGTQTSPFKPAKFSITGGGSFTLSPIPPLVLNGPTGSTAINLVPSGAIITEGTSKFVYVGGQLTLNPGQLPGSYQNFNGLLVTVNY
jgi:hypothetical protein